MASSASSEHTNLASATNSWALADTSKEDGDCASAAAATGPVLWRGCGAHVRVADEDEGLAIRTTDDDDDDPDMSVGVAAQVDACDAGASAKCPASIKAGRATCMTRLHRAAAAALTTRAAHAARRPASRSKETRLASAWAADRAAERTAMARDRPPAVNRHRFCFTPSSPPEPGM